MSIVNFFLAFSALSIFLLSVVVLSRNHKDPVNLSFALFLLIGSLWPLTIYLFWLKAIYLIGSIIPALFLYFAVTLVKKKTPSFKIAILCLITVLIFVLTLFLTSDIDLNFWKTCWAGYYFVFMGAAIIYLYVNYRKSTGFVKTQLRFVLLSVIFPVLMACIPNVVLPIFNNYDYIYLGPISLTIMGGIITYAIIRHRFLDIRLLIARSVTYGLLLVILASFYAVGLFMFGDPDDLIVSTILALIMTFTFRPLKQLLEKTTNRIFYKDAYDTDELLFTLSQMMSSALTLKVLAENVMEVLRIKMHIVKLEVFVEDRTGKEVLQTVPAGQAPYVLNKEVIAKLQKAGEMLVFDELPEGETKDLLRQQEISIFLCLKTTHRLVGFLIMGNKASGEIYFDQDIKTLSIMAPEFAVAVENALHYETLREEIKAATEELRTANDRLKELDRLKDEFISIASHDLRTPIGTVKNFLWLTLNKKYRLGEKVKDNLNRAYAAAERTASLISDMLDVSRIEGGRIEMKMQAVTLCEIMGEIKDDISAKAKEKKIMIKISCADNIKIVSDPDRLLQIINNLVDNAVKFTPHGGVVEILIKQTEKEAQILVTDTGIGIDKNDFPKLFTKFGRLHNTLSSVPEAPGTGLGLYITKKMVELLKGTITVESTVGKGTTFTCSFPR